MRRPCDRPHRAIGVVLVLLTCGYAVDSLPLGGLGAARADDLSDQQQQVKDDLAEIERLEQKSAQLNEEYLGYLNEKAALEADIAVSQQHIDDQQAQLSALEDQLAAVAVQQFIGSGSGGLGMLGDTATATDSLQRDQLVRTAVNAGAASTDDYHTLLDELAAEHDDLRSKQERVAKLAEQAADALARTTQAGLDYQAELARDQATLGDLLAEEQARQIAEAAAQHAAEVARAKADQEAAAERAAAERVAQDQAAQDQAAQDQAAQDQATPSTNGAGSGSNGGNTTSTSTSTSTSTKVDTPIAVDSDDAVSGDASFGATADATVETASGASDASDASDTSASNASSSNLSGNDTSSAVDAAPAVSSRAQVAVAAARSQLGVPYQFARSSPGVAFDCSGLTAYAWAQAGVSIPHQSAMQYSSMPHVPVAEVQPGDLLFFYSPISHVSIYIGNGMQIHAPAPGKFVELASVNWAKVVGASRPG